MKRALLPLLVVGLAAVALRVATAERFPASGRDAPVAALSTGTPAAAQRAATPAAAATPPAAPLDRPLDDQTAPAVRVAALEGLLAQPDAALRQRAVHEARSLVDAHQGGLLGAAALRGLGRAACAGHEPLAATSRRALAALERATEAEIALAAGDALDGLGPDAATTADLQVALARAGLPEARAVLVRALCLGDAAAARSALEGLLLADPSPLVRAAVLEQAPAWAGVDLVQVVKDGLAVPALRATAAGLVPRLRSADLDRQVLDALPVEADQAAARALARAALCRPGGAEAVERVALSESVSARAAAEELGVAARRTGEASLERILASGRDPAARATACAALARSGRLAPAALAGLAANDPAPAVRAAASAALARRQEGS